MSQKRYIILAKAYDKKNKLLSTATNTYKRSHPLQSFYAKQVGLDDKIYLHAELLALIRAGDKKVHRLTVERYNSDGQPALAKPCKICSKAIESYGVSVVEYTSSTGWIKERLK
jgi:deoxycytidylate deaminase